VTSVVPAFGLSPFVGENAPKDRGLLYYNFLREYLEELHCLKDAREVERKLKEEHLSTGLAENYHRWLYSQEHARQLIECAERGDFTLYYIGFGFNLTNGNPNIGLLAKLDDPSISQHIKDSIFENWEIATGGIQFVDPRSERLGELFSRGQLDPASSFFLSRAHRYLV
jgi:hypothetical protein